MPRTKRKPQAKPIYCCSVPNKPAEISQDVTKDGGRDWREITLLGDGETRMADGSSLVLDEAAASEVVASIKHRGIDIVVDRDHSTIRGIPKGHEAPAMGWIDRNSVKYTPGRGIHGSVKWTDAGAGYLHSGGYRYTSPVVRYDKKTKRVERFHSLSLTNVPMTLNAQQLKAASDGVYLMAEQPDENMNTGPDPAMLLGQIKEAMDLDVPPEADIITVLQAILAKAKGASEGEGGEGEAGSSTAAASELAKLLGVEQVGDGKAVKAAAQTLVDKLTVSTKALAALSEQVKTLQQTQVTNDVEDALAKYTGSKINPNDEEQVKQCRAFAERDLTGFCSFMETMPAVLPESGRTTPPGGTAGGHGGRLDRKGVITKARQEFRTDSSLRAFSEDDTNVVNLALRDAGMMALTDEEIRAA